ncbi:ligase-associated DNA damage response exonuclease [Rubellicoccus peritrichatus]|uniref:Ligase-associated DNA damage response exonuclease n=1 Tax=Rubellicoccus peritrichatus TaxID=3080537 RepID=A0AAQ3LC53_9BACT|nr:ligase-associated DNA damage response exonuclease [Puniceicoccus sp. CR14]WOO43056.1 ligase-associated DNA damage response exonuclease [Puniceicoccus sp. CR14]
MPKPPLIVPTKEGLYCEAGDFFIDPWRAVDRAVITHAHSDHARSGSRSYLCAKSGENILRHRIGIESDITGVPFGEVRSFGDVRVSLHPAGHILGSAQVRVEHRGEVWVVSGDYKTVADISCEAFEPVPCHTFITECTFGLPAYRWLPTETVFSEINNWWRRNQEQNRTSMLFAYSLGKAQRVLAGINSSIGPIGVHGSVAPFLPLYREQGIRLPDAEKVTVENAKSLKGKALIVAPGSAANTPWMKKLAPCSLAFASGWMAIRGNRRRQALDRGFVLSDHVDWTGLIDAVKATRAEQIGVTHGYTEPFVRYANEVLGLKAYTVPTHFEGEAQLESKDRNGKAEELNA